MFNIPYDKLLHFGAGVVISALVGTILGSFYGLGAAVGAGVGKELSDYISVKYFNGSHTVDAFDALASSAGGFIPFVVLYWLGV